MIRWNLRFSVEVETDSEEDLHLLERWDRVAKELNGGEDLGHDQCLMVDVLENLESLAQIKRRALALARVKEQGSEPDAQND